MRFKILILLLAVLPLGAKPPATARGHRIEITEAKDIPAWFIASSQKCETVEFRDGEKWLRLDFKASTVTTNMEWDEAGKLFLKTIRKCMGLWDPLDHAEPIPR